MRVLYSKVKALCADGQGQGTAGKLAAAAQLADGNLPDDRSIAARTGLLLGTARNMIKGDQASIEVPTGEFISCGKIISSFIIYFMLKI